MPLGWKQTGSEGTWGWDGMVPLSLAPVLVGLLFSPGFSELKWVTFTFLNTPTEDHRNWGIQKYTHPLRSIHNTMAWPSGCEWVRWVPDCHVFSTFPPSLFPHKGQLYLFLCIPKTLPHESGLFCLLPRFLSASSARCINQPLWKKSLLCYWNWQWLNNVIHKAVVSACSHADQTQH